LCGCADDEFSSVKAAARTFSDARRDIAARVGVGLMPFGNSGRGLSRRDTVKIARRFNAGWAEHTDKSRTAENPTLKPDLLSSLRDSVISKPHHPALKRRAIFTVSLRDEGRPIPERH